MSPTTTHPHSVAAAKSLTVDKVVRDRRAICAYIASRGPDGATDEEIASALTYIGPNSLRPRRGELQERQIDDEENAKRFGCITASLGVERPTLSGRMATVWHITPKGVKNLDLPTNHWHSETKATA